MRAATETEEADIRVLQIANIGGTLMIGRASLIAATATGGAHVVTRGLNYSMCSPLCMIVFRLTRNVL